MNYYVNNCTVVPLEISDAGDTAGSCLVSSILAFGEAFPYARINRRTGICTKERQLGKSKDSDSFTQWLIQHNWRTSVGGKRGGDTRLKFRFKYSLKEYADLLERMYASGVHKAQNWGSVDPTVQMPILIRSLRELGSEDGVMFSSLDAARKEILKRIGNTSSMAYRVGMSWYDRLGWNAPEAKVTILQPMSIKEEMETGKPKEVEYVSVEEPVKQAESIVSEARFKPMGRYTMSILLSAPENIDAAKLEALTGIIEHRFGVFIEKAGLKVGVIEVRKSFDTCEVANIKKLSREIGNELERLWEVVWK